MHSWSRGDKIALWSLVVAIVSCAVAIKSIPRPDTFGGYGDPYRATTTDTMTGVSEDTAMMPLSTVESLGDPEALLQDSTTVVTTTDTVHPYDVGGPYETAPSHYTLGFKNSCSVPIYVAVNYRDVGNNWRTRGWWTVNPGETAKPAGVESNNTILYLYAENQIQSLYWEGSRSAGSIVRNVPTHEFELRDDTPLPFAETRPLSFYMWQITGSPGEYTHEFTCSG
jgi:hypothetical protein